MGIKIKQVVGDLGDSHIPILKLNVKFNAKKHE